MGMRWRRAGERAGRVGARVRAQGTLFLFLFSFSFSSFPLSLFNATQQVSRWPSGASRPGRETAAPAKADVFVPTWDRPGRWLNRAHVGPISAQRPPRLCGRSTAPDAGLLGPSPGPDSARGPPESPAWPPLPQPAHHTPGTPSCIPGHLPATPTFISLGRPLPRSTDLSEIRGCKAKTKIALFFVCS